MTEQEVCRLLGLDEGICEVLPALSADTCGRLRFLLRNDRKAFLDEVSALPSPETAFLRFCLMMAVEVREEYRMAGIEEQVWLDTMSDIRIWTEKYRRDTGRTGLIQFGWLSHHLTLEIFRLGRLQFEPSPLGRAVTLPSGTLPPETPVLNVHIAEGEPLLYEAVQASYEKARGFFKNPHPVFVCDSWLLSPALEELLPPTSNILAFQRDFTLFEVDFESRQAEERIFGAPCDDFSSYPEKTSLQRRAKARLLAGGKIPAASGIILG